MLLTYGLMCLPRASGRQGGELFDRVTELKRSVGGQQALGLMLASAWWVRGRGQTVEFLRKFELVRSF